MAVQPEYNHAIPGPLKNLLDWLSRPVSATEAQVLAEKPVALAGASIGMSGASHAQDQLVGMLSFLDAHVMNKPRLCIPHIATQADEQGRLKLESSAPYLEAQADASSGSSSANRASEDLPHLERVSRGRGI